MILHVVRNKPYHGPTMFMCMLASGGSGLAIGMYDSCGKYALIMNRDYDISQFFIRI
jgi:hypothetical protein